MFLMGPIKQVQKMFEKGRIFATIIYVAAMGATLWAALHVRLRLPVDFNRLNNPFVL